jgi:hypothetical protein
MAETYVHEERRGGRKFLTFLIGLLLGLLFGALAGGAIDDNDSNTSTTSNANGNTSQQSGSDNTSGTLVQANTATQLDNQLSKYAQFLVEASREGVDVPSEEATASKAALDTATADLVKALNNNQTVQADLNALNAAFIAYAAQARNGDEHTAVDQAMNKLVGDLQQVYSVQNNDQMQSSATSFKNTVLESVRNFVKNDYTGSYAKQLQAQNEVNNLFSQLKNKQS